MQVIYIISIALLANLLTLSWFPVVEDLNKMLQLGELKKLLLLLSLGLLHLAILCFLISFFESFRKEGLSILSVRENEKIRREKTELINKTIIK